MVPRAPGGGHPVMARNVVTFLSGSCYKFGAFLVPDSMGIPNDFVVGPLAGCGWHVGAFAGGGADVN